MKKIYIYKSANSDIPMQNFIDTCDKKVGEKILQAISNLATYPENMTEPHVKHFTIERYSHLYELRVRIKNMVRIIFMLDKNGDIILLHAFFKKHKRNTMQALEKSLKLLDDIDENIGELVLYEGGDADKR